MNEDLRRRLLGALQPGADSFLDALQGNFEGGELVDATLMFTTLCMEGLVDKPERGWMVRGLTRSGTLELARLQVAAAR